MKWNFKAVCIIAAVALGAALPIILYSLFFATVPAQPTDMRPLPSWQQWLVCLTAFGVKPVYLIISMTLVVMLRRQQEPDLVALRWGLLIFWLGEIACAVNYIAFGGHADLWEFLHDYGMAVAFSFVTFAVLEGLDNRVLKYSAPNERCAMLKLCRECIKYAKVPCKFRRIFAFTIPASIAVAVIPLCVPLKTVSYNSVIVGTTVNYTHPLSSQLFETRYCIAMAIALLTLSWSVLLFKRKDPIPLAKVVFAAAMGPMSFGLMRLFLYSAFSQKLLWFEAWEEFTELLFILAVAYVLWIFRRSLFQQSAKPEAAI